MFLGVEGFVVVFGVVGVDVFFFCKVCNFLIFVIFIGGVVLFLYILVDLVLILERLFGIIEFMNLKFGILLLFLLNVILFDSNLDRFGLCMN